MNEIITYLGIITSFFAAKKIVKNFKISSQYNRIHTINIRKSPKIKSIYSKRNDIDSALLLFKKEIENNIEADNLLILNKNIDSIKIKRFFIMPESLFFKALDGAYYHKSNKIHVNFVSEKRVLNHELLHASSTIYDDENWILHSGFIQQTRCSEIGRGITEGYTQVLDSRIFKNDLTASESYEAVKMICFFLEKIVGFKNMEKYYFNADLNSLITNLENYDNKNNIFDFISRIDFILKYYNNGYGSIINKVPGTKKKIDLNLEKINLYLKKWYLVKLKQENYDENTIIKKYEEYENKINNTEVLQKRPYFKSKYKSFKNAYNS